MNTGRSLVLASFSMGVVLGAVTPSAAASYTFTLIDVPGATFTFAQGINDRGEVVGSFDDTGGNHHGFLRSRGQFTIIDAPTASDTTAAGINNLSQIVGSYVINAQSHGFLLDAGRFTVIEPSGATSSRANAINDLGQIVGEYADASGSRHGFLWTHGQFTSIELPHAIEATSVAPKGINGADQIVGQFTDTGGQLRGFRLEARGSGIVLVALEPHGINDIGEIVGRYTAPSTSVGFLLAYGLSTDIVVPAGAGGGTIANGINNRGQIVGSYSGDFREPPLFRMGGFVATPPNEVEDESGNPSPDGTRVPHAPAIFDGDLVMWTLGPAQEVLRGGVQARGGFASELLWYGGRIYVLGDDMNWWQWTGTTWSLFGPDDPSSGFQRCAPDYRHRCGGAAPPPHTAWPDSSR
jgi:probable HAF family extracellular repeat protein